MQVIVNTDSGLFYLEGKHVVKKIGDIIDLPKEIAQKDLKRGVVLEFVDPEGYEEYDDEEDQPIKKKKKKKRTPVE